jgi:hypothetical protein
MMRDLSERPGPEVERAYAFDLAFCADPYCGLHIIPSRVDGTPICEIVMSVAQTLHMVEQTKDVLYEKATKR